MRTSAGAIHYLHRDHRASMVAETDSSGAAELDSLRTLGGPITIQYYATVPVEWPDLAMTKAGTLSHLHRDQLGNVVSLTDASAATSTGTHPAGLPTDRLFSSQTRDPGSDGFYFFKARYYDATIGKFQAPDSVVPDPKNPPRLTDPWGHRLETPRSGSSVGGRSAGWRSG